MEKTIIDFTKEKNGGHIEVQAVQLKKEEHEKCRKELKELKADITNMDGEYIHAEISGGIEIVEKLEKLGWSFG